MKILWGHKDGGPESRVRMWGFEAKSVFSILVLRFEEGTREAFHTHAFNAWSWVLAGALVEQTLPEKDADSWAEERQYAIRKGATEVEVHDLDAWLQARVTWAGFGPSWWPVHTDRRRFHKVAGGRQGAWVLSFRGPWWTGWRELDPATGAQAKLAHGRTERE